MARDYRAEEARRNARARAEGYTSRAAQRGAIERGERKPLNPDRIRSPKTIAAYQRYQAAHPQLKPPGLSPTEQREIDRAQKWSDEHAQRPSAQFVPARAVELAIPLPTFARRYNWAWTDGYSIDRKHPGSWHRWWMIEVMEWTEEQYNEKYGGD